VKSGITSTSVASVTSAANAAANFDAKQLLAVAHRSEQQAQADDRLQMIMTVANIVSRASAAAPVRRQHQGDDQRKLDRGDRQGQHQRAEGSHSVRDDSA
jgi:hypothetical protein